MRFLPGTQDAVVGDRGFKQILLLTSVVQGFNSRVLATEAQGVNAPTDVEVATDQQRVWIADAGGSGLLIVDLNSGAVTTVNCPFPPASVTRLAGRSVFLVAGQDGATAGLWAPETANGAVWRLTTAQFK
jgi:DNA-binding beta-propeller fold protein YncE